MPVTAAAVLAADQVTKSLILASLPTGSRRQILGSVVGLRVSKNPGGIFGFMPDAGLLFLILTAIIVAVVLIWSLRSGESPVLFGLVVGGGLGNLADRVLRGPGLLRGRVIDFIDLSFWPTFNLADAAISVGVLLLLIQGFRTKPV